MNTSRLSVTAQSKTQSKTRDGFTRPTGPTPCSSGTHNGGSATTLEPIPLLPLGVNRVDQHPHANTRQQQTNRHNIRHRGLPGPADLVLHRFQRGLNPIPRISPHPTHNSAQGLHVTTALPAGSWHHIEGVPGRFVAQRVTTGRATGCSASECGFRGPRPSSVLQHFEFNDRADKVGAVSGVL